MHPNSEWHSRLPYRGVIAAAPGALECELKGDRVLIGGKAVKYLQREIFI